MTYLLSYNVTAWQLDFTDSSVNSFKTYRIYVVEPLSGKPSYFFQWGRQDIGAGGGQWSTETTDHALTIARDRRQEKLGKGYGTVKYSTYTIPNSMALSRYSLDNEFHKATNQLNIGLKSQPLPTPTLPSDKKMMAEMKTSLVEMLKRAGRT